MIRFEFDRKIKPFLSLMILLLDALRGVVIVSPLKTYLCIPFLRFCKAFFFFFLSFVFELDSSCLRTRLECGICFFYDTTVVCYLDDL